ncbi:MAG TPA: DNA (cytosine-5-)-methyltransferase [Gammaproteobacteria bacterium]|nr:DNA (cytosine-5-)-methyltransferase [Gammaproteobacteria bacterium]
MKPLAIGSKDCICCSGINVLSLFDGMSCGQIALERAGIEVNQYFAAEIDKYAMSITKKNYPNTKHLGDVKKVFAKDLPNIDLLIGGSPCQGFSIAGNQLNFDDPRSALFFEFVRVLKETKPKYFLLENVRMKKEYQDIITEYLGVEPITINSSLVSAQNRQRLYWSNIPGIEQPEDKGLILRDILESNADEFRLSEKAVDYMKRLRNGKPRFEYHKNPLDGKAACIVAVQYKGVPYGVIKEERPCEVREFKKESTCHHVATATDIKGNESIKRVYAETGKSPTLTTMGGGHREPKVLCMTERRTEEAKRIRREHYKETGKDFSPRRGKELVERKDSKSNCLTTSMTKEHILKILDGKEPTYRKLSPLECERLQTVPDFYTEGVSNTQRYKMLGNGWTVSVISHIFGGVVE